MASKIELKPEQVLVHFDRELTKSDVKTASGITGVANCFLRDRYCIVLIVGKCFDQLQVGDAVRESLAQSNL